MTIPMYKWSGPAVQKLTFPNKPVRLANVIDLLDFIRRRKEKSVTKLRSKFTR